MKKLGLILILIACAGMVQATTTTIDFKFSRGGGYSTTSLGDLVASQLTTYNGGANQSTIYTITNLTLDAVGTGDDEVTFTLGLHAVSTSGSVIGIGSSYGAWGVNDDNDTSASLIQSGQSLGFTFDNATVTLGVGATETASIAFNGFTGFSALNVGSGETFDITGTASNDLVNGTSFQANNDIHSFTGPEDEFAIAANAGAMRYKNVMTGVTVTTVIPEPATFGMVMVFGGVILFVRRNKMMM